MEKSEKQLIFFILVVIFVALMSWLISNKTTYVTPTYYVYIASSKTTTKASMAQYYSKYHKAGCRYLLSTPKKVTVEQAENEGYAPCPVCNPDYEYNRNKKRKIETENTSSMYITLKFIAMLYMYFVIPAYIIGIEQSYMSKFGALVVAILNSAVMYLLISIFLGVSDETSIIMGVIAGIINYILLKENTETTENTNTIYNQKYKQPVDQKSMDYYLNLLLNSLDSSFYLIKKPFTVSYEFEQQFYSSLQEKAQYEQNIRFLLERILVYIGLPPKGVILNINYGNIFDNKEIAGDYSPRLYTHEINLYLNKYNSIEDIISVLAHECSHYLLKLRDIKLEEKIKNEQLTDVCAVYLGFGSFMLEGYKRKRYRSDTKAIIRKIGYINTDEIQYVMNEITEYKKSNNIY